MFENVVVDQDLDALISDTMETFSNENITKLNGRYKLAYSKKLKKVILPNLSTVNGDAVMNYCDSLTYVDIGNLSSTGYMFYGCDKLETLVSRRTSSAFSEGARKLPTSMRSKYAKVIAPSSRVNDIRMSIFSSRECVFALGDERIENQYGCLSNSYQDVIQLCKGESYDQLQAFDRFFVPIVHPTLGNIDLVFTMVGKNVFTATGSNETAHTTWMILGPFEEIKFDDSTSSWQDSYIRQYLNTTLYDMLPSALKEAIVAIDLTTDNTVTSDKIWIPSIDDFTERFTDYYPNLAASRKKSHLNNGESTRYWLRDATGNTSKPCRYMDTSGMDSTTTPTSQIYYEFGFCL